MSSSIQKRLVIYFAAFTFLFGGVSLVVLRGNMPLASGLFTLAYLANAAIMTVLCWRRTLRSPHLKVHWALFCAQAGSNIVIAIVAILTSTTPLIANFVTFFMFCAYIPAFLLISLPAGRRYFQQFIWIDLAQAIFAMYVGYAILYQARPFTHDTPVGIGGVPLFHLFLAGDVLTLVGAFLHIFTAVNKDEMRFFRLFFWVSAIGTAGVFLHNVFLLRDPKETLTGIPVLLASFLCILLIAHSPRETTQELPARSKGWMADLINIASPALPSMVLLILGILVEGRYPPLGHAAIATAFVLFVARATFYQRNFEVLQSNLENVHASLKLLSNTDELTGVANRRALENAFFSEWQHGMRSGSPLSVFLIDVDFFKSINDQLGHQAGDEYLVAIVGALYSPLRRSIDIVGRYGGDEFVAILPSTDAAAAETTAEKLCDAVRQLHIENRSTGTGFATISIGIATCATFLGSTPNLLLGAADAALYDAKASGRNCWRSRRLALEDGPTPTLTIPRANAMS